MNCPWCNRNDIDYMLSPGAVFYCQHLNSGLCYYFKKASHMSEQPRDSLLQEREKTHGNFEYNAKISQEIKRVLHNPFGETVHPFVLIAIHREALDMIALKLSRILSGQADFKDHWYDIAGYAKLAAEACSK